jgi:peptide/nickel transport system substrate-binding protein
MWTRRNAVALIAALGVTLGSTVLTACNDDVQKKSAGTDTLRVGVEEIPASLDPSQSFWRAQLGILELSSGTLTKLERDGKRVTMELASSVEPAGDKRFVVKLKPDLKFSDGSPLTADDVAATFGHYLTDEAAGLGFMFEAIKQVAAEGDDTVNFDLKRAYPSLPFILSYPNAAILPSETIESRGPKGLYKLPPAPTAARFQVTSMNPTKITLKANPNYTGKRPSAKTIVFEKIADPAARLAQLQSGQLDFADQIPPKSVAQVSDPLDARTATSVNGTVFLSMNNRDGSVLSDPRIRRAIAVAIDRNQINQLVWKGNNKLALGMFAGSSRYSHEFLPTAPETDEAKALLAGTKCASGCTLQLIAATGNEVYREVALSVQQQLKAIGIRVNMTLGDPATVDERSRAGNFDLRPMFNFDNADIPDGYLFWLLGPAVDASYTGYSSPQMSQLMNETSSATGSARTAAIDQMNALFEKDVPFAPIGGMIVVSASRLSPELFDLDPNMFYHVN